MAIINLGENPNPDLNNNERDTLILPAAEDSIYQANFFQSEDRIDIAAIPETALELISSAQPLTDGVRLNGNFGTLTLLGIAIDELREENFIRNSPPVAMADGASTTEGISVEIPVLENDSDPDGQQVLLESFQAVSTAGGTVNRNDNGTENLGDDLLLYTPAPGFLGADSFSYSISDGAGGTATGGVNVTVAGGNNAPIAVDDVETTTSGVPVTIGVLDNDIDLENDVLSVVDFSESTSGGGTVVRDGSNLVYNPALNFTGIDSFNYSITDGEFTNTASVRVAVGEPPNRPPVATEDRASATENMPVSIAVLDNDMDPDGDPLFIVGIPNSTTFGGTVVIDGFNNLVYNPALGFTGTDSFSYSIADIRGGTDVGTVTITVAEIPNRPPIAVEDSANTIPGIPVSINVLENDSDPDEGDPLSIVGVAPTTANGGRVSINDSALEYRPDTEFVGTDVFGYTITDSFGAIGSSTVTVTVSPVNLDIDNNGEIDVFTDGVLALRYLLEFTGEGLIANAIGPGASRSKPEDIITYLDGARDLMLDVDGNGMADFATDGNLIIRYLFGFIGDALIADAIGSDATRTDANSIVEFLRSFDFV